MEALAGAASSSLFAPTFPAHQPPSRVALRARPCRGSLRAAASAPGGAGKDDDTTPNGIPVIKGMKLLPMGKKILFYLAIYGSVVFRTTEIVPIWVADYVLGSYGTGAIMAVPAHDSHGHEFALQYKLPIIKVVSPPNGNCDPEETYADDGIMINSSNSSSGLNINGMLSQDAALKVTDWVESNDFGEKKVNYKLPDWLFARQRYWGEPFPVIYLDDTNEMVPLSENELPLTLPELDDFTPTGTGEPPLTKATDFLC